jgi:hypothetical protein
LKISQIIKKLNLLKDLKLSKMMRFKIINFQIIIILIKSHQILETSQLQSEIKIEKNTEMYFY